MRIDVEGEGYRLAYRVAADNLRLGINVIADSCNPIDLTRREWVNVAVKENVGYVNIEVACSDLTEHQSLTENQLHTSPQEQKIGDLCAFLEPRHVQ